MKYTLNEAEIKHYDTFCGFKANLKVLELVSLFCINLRFLSLTDIALILYCIFLSVNSPEDSVTKIYYFTEYQYQYYLGILHCLLVWHYVILSVTVRIGELAPQQ